MKSAAGTSSAELLAPLRERERLGRLRTERQHFWVRLGVAAVAVLIAASMDVAAPGLALASTVSLLVFPLVARALARSDAPRARLREVTRAAAAFYVATGSMWVVLLSPSREDIAIAIAAPTVAAAATFGLRAAAAAIAALTAAEVAAEYLRVAVYRHPLEPPALTLELAAILGIGTIVGLAVEALRTERRSGERLRRAQALLSGLAPQIAAALDEEEAFRRILLAATGLTDSDGGLIAARDAGSERYRVRVVANMPPGLVGRELPPGEGITSMVMERGETVVAARAEVARISDLDRGVPWGVVMATPVRIGTETVAAPVVWRKDVARRFDALDRTVLESLATLATSAVANARLYARAELERRRLRLLHEVRDVVGSSLELDAILARALEQLELAFGMDRAFVLLLDEGAGLLRVGAHRGGVREDVKELVIPVEEGLSGAAVRDRRIVNVPDVSTDPRYILTAPDVRSEIALPLVAAGEAVGVLLLSSPRLAAFGPDEEQLLALFAGELSGAVVNARAFEAQREAAVRDDRTGLYNHRYFQEALAHEVARAQREREPLSMLFLDLDDLKGLNDRHGHGAGDAAICTVATAMNQRRRATDVAARLGGEEFALLLPATAVEDAAALAEQIRAEVARAAHGVPASCTVSVGVATLPDHARDAFELRRAADLAMYEAKRRGRDRVVCA